MASSDWKQALDKALQGLGDRIRDVLHEVEEALSDALDPEPELVPVPVRPDRRHPQGRRR